MPYSSVADVPSYVPEAKRKQWLEVFNSAYAKAKKDGKSDKDAEASAFAQANGVAGPKGEKMEKVLVAQIVKVEQAKRLVYGVLAEDAPDKDGEQFDYPTSKPFFQSWNERFDSATQGKSVGNLRAMHGPISAGKFVTMEYLDDAKRIEVAAKVVDDKEWQKVCEGVYTGFSIGARVVGKKWEDGQVRRYTADPYEGSLVDNPAMYGATFSAVKADGSVEQRKFIGGANREENEMELQEVVSKVEGLEKKFDEFGGKVLAFISKQEEESADAGGDDGDADDENPPKKKGKKPVVADGKLDAPTTEAIQKLIAAAVEKSGAEKVEKLAKTVDELHEMVSHLTASVKKLSEAPAPPKAAKSDLGIKKGDDGKEPELTEAQKAAQAKDPTALIKKSQGEPQYFEGSVRA